VAAAAVIFRSTVFDDTSERRTRWNPLGAECAGYLVTALRGRGAQIDDPPVAASGGWLFTARLDGALFRVDVEVTRRLDTKQEVFVVRVQKHYGFWQTLLGRGRTFEEAQALCRELGAILSDGDVFHDVEWLERA
jgi:hypothetical protein